MSMEIVSDSRCEAKRGGNQCGRTADFVIQPDGEDTAYYACKQDVGAVMIENEIDSAYVERIY
jgi:hypothetical protein